MRRAWRRDRGRDVCSLEQARTRYEHSGKVATESADTSKRALESVISLARRPRSDAYSAAPCARRSRTKARILVGELRPISRVYDTCQVDSERSTSTQ